MRLFLKREGTGVSASSDVTEIDCIHSYALSFASKQDKDSFNQTLLRAINRWEPRGYFSLKDITEYKVHATHGVGDNQWWVSLSFNKNCNMVNLGTIPKSLLGEGYTNTTFTSRVKAVLNHWLKTYN